MVIDYFQAENHFNMVVSGEILVSPIHGIFHGIWKNTCSDIMGAILAPG